MAADKITFLTSWYAQAEHGGFYQAKAAGLYEKAGLDVTIKMGGPQVNGMQLLLAGEADVMMGYDFQVLKSLEKGIPVITVGDVVPEGPAGHDDARARQGPRTTSRTRPSWSRRQAAPPGGRGCRRKYGYTDAQTQAYTFNLQPFFNDKNVVQQSYPSSEPFQALQKGMPVKFFLFADNGYPPYGTTMVTTHQARRRNAGRRRAASCAPRSKAGRAISRAIRRRPTR